MKCWQNGWRWPKRKPRAPILRPGNIPAHIAKDIGLPEECVPDRREDVFGLGPRRGPGFWS